MGLIQEEIKESKKIDFKTVRFKKFDIVEISRENVVIAEAMIRNDSDYLVMYNTKAEKSGAYFLAKLKDVYEAERKGYKVKENVEEIIKDAVIAIDNENSTHINSDKIGREVIPQRIYAEYKKGRLFELLKNPGEEYELFHIIEEKTKPKDKKMKGRVNTSFASKFCHYASFFIFEGKKEQDNYSIWDSVLRKSIPIYLEYYKIDKKKYNLENYADYQKAIYEIIDKAYQENGVKISRNGFDHLLWYYYKGRMDVVKSITKATK